MNFGEVIKKELISRPLKDKSAKRAFLAGILRGNGLLYEKDGETGLDFYLKDEQSLMVVSECFSALYGYQLREVAVEEDRLNRTERFIVTLLGGRVEEILTDLAIFENKGDGLSVSFDMYGGEITATEDKLKAFIRGLFLTSGGCTLPDMGEDSNTGYHLELVFSHPRPASATADKLRAQGIITKITRRKESYLVYIKSAEGIKDFIAFLPAPVSVLKMTDLIINRELTNNSNRQKNCDLGNVNRQIEASAKQIKAVKIIAEKMGLDKLKPDLRETAVARIDFPEDTLTELAQRLNVTKSCINHRMRKLIEISEKL